MFGKLTLVKPDMHFNLHHTFCSKWIELYIVSKEKTDSRIVSSNHFMGEASILTNYKIRFLFFFVQLVA
jgi:hypothetical protein